MSVTRDIVMTYRGPRAVVRRLLTPGAREDRALVFVLLAGLMIFVATTPFQAREAQTEPEGALTVRLYWSAFLWILIAPLLLYGVAALLWVLARLTRRRIGGFAIRLTLFWALLASTPVLLLLGMVAGLIGPGPQLSLMAGLWLAVFFCFWLAGLIEAETGGQP